MGVNHTLTIELPQELHERLQQVANWANVSEEIAFIEGMSWLYTTLASDPDTTLNKLRTLSQSVEKA